MNADLKQTPLVSIMMTTYNRADLITAAIESVLKQTYQNWELLILDDASRDNTSSVVQKFSDPRIKYLPASTNLGITRNRNRGLDLARGEYVAVLDSDDLWTNPNKLKAQVNFLETKKDYVAVGTQVEVINETGEVTAEFRYALEDKTIRNRLLFRNQFTHSSLLLRRSALDMYDETLPIWEDYDLILRLGQSGHLANLPEVMTAYRRHSTNISKTTENNGAKAHLTIIKKHRHHYPFYYLALVKAYLRLWL